MRLSILHEMQYLYSSPADYTIQYLRLTPQTTVQQKVLSWNLELPMAASLFSDGFGNTTHVLVIDGPHGKIRIRVQGEVTAEDLPLILPEVGPLGPDIYRRFTALTAPDEALNGFAETFRHQTANDREAGILGLMSAVREAMDYSPGIAEVDSSAAQAFSRHSGVCQDHVHVFVSCCRRLNIPARFVSGYLAPKKRPFASRSQRTSVGSHAWAEAWIEGMGWQGFEVANDTRAHGRHVRVAVGLEYLDAWPVRGYHRGGRDESLRIEVDVTEPSPPPRGLLREEP